MNKKTNKSVITVRGKLKVKQEGPRQWPKMIEEKARFEQLKKVSIAFINSLKSIDDIAEFKFWPEGKLVIETDVFSTIQELEALDKKRPKEGGRARKARKAIESIS